MSLLSDIAVPIAKLVNMKKYKEKDFLNPRRDTDFLNKKNFDKTLILDEQFIDEYQVLTIFSEESYNKHVVFLHGGAYVMRAVRAHKNIIEKLVKKFHLFQKLEKFLQDCSYFHKLAKSWDFSHPVLLQTAFLL